MVPFQSIFVAFLFFLSLDDVTPYSSHEFLPNCSQPFTCGSVKDITYPFTGGNRPSYCGLPQFALTCLSDDDNSSSTFLTSKSLIFKVREVNQTKQTLILSRLDLYNTTCTPILANTSFDSASFIQTSNNKNLTLLYGCSGDLRNVSGIRRTTLLSCESNGTATEGFYSIGSLSSNPGFVLGHCNFTVTVPALASRVDDLIANKSVLGDVLRDGFEMAYINKYQNECDACMRRPDRVCGYDSVGKSSVCLCNDHICKGKRSYNASVAIGISVTGVAIIITSLGGCFCVLMLRRRRKAAVKTRSKEVIMPSLQVNKMIHMPNLSLNTYSNVKTDQERDINYDGLKVFNFAELEEVTDNFDPSRELGSGGYGTVYYGVLSDGRQVAVKRLFDHSRKRIEQFMNEVEILNKLRHRNLVMLYGCTSKKTRDLILVYEYVPNRTVADHLLRTDKNTEFLTWPVRMNIALETAEALAYLHGSDVIHRDVKTNNILLDNNFQVKVADFGLSRLFPNNVSHVSTAPQGTPGYVDPEYYQTYQLTDKSDVYSFGVVLIELISSLPAVDTSRHRLDINLAYMAINKIQSCMISELVDPALGFDTDPAVKSTTTLVAELAFRCLQQERDLRPTMAEVRDNLKKILDGIYAVEIQQVIETGEDYVGHLKVVSSTSSDIITKGFSTSTDSSS